MSFKMRCLTYPTEMAWFNITGPRRVLQPANIQAEKSAGVFRILYD
jgi:hypothetical protein